MNASMKNISFGTRPSWLRAIIAGGLVAGAFDITFAIIVWGSRGATPIQIGQAIASGLVGREAAAAGGVSLGIFGLVLHFVMTTLMAAVYYMLAKRIPMLVKHAFAFGIAYGLAIYLTMNYVVVPLSARGASTGSAPLAIIVSEVLVHMFGVGLTIALFTRRALRHCAQR